VAKERHTAAFVVGMMMGGAAGAAITLWKTPLSGAQVRARITERAASVKQQVIALGERLGIELGEPESAPPVAMVASATTPVPPPAPPLSAIPEPPLPTPTAPDLTPAPQPEFIPPPQTVPPEPPPIRPASGPPLTPDT
jgi:hypothetical protein